MLLGIAGKIGSGKSRVAALLEERGWRTLDLDVVAHDALEACRDAVLREFGTTNRRELAAVAFSDAAALRRLEDITYPWIETEARRWLDSETDRPAAIHAINLHKTDLVKDCDAILWVRCPRCVRRRRVVARDGRPWSELKHRFRAQRGLNPKLLPCDAEIYSVRNSGNDASLVDALDRVLERLFRKADRGGAS